jgi:tetratricopeptide (TPR) repeat protein
MGPKKQSRKERASGAKIAQPAATVHKKTSEGFSDLQTGAIVSACLAFLLYVLTVGFDYTHDDYSVISENTVVSQGTKAIGQIFKTSYRHGYMNVQDGLYRPLSLAMFAIEWQYFPDEPWFPHLMNVLVYCFSASVLFLFLTKLIRNAALLLPLLITLLFVAHPLHTEIVASIKSRDELLSFLFSVLCLNSLVSYHEKRERLKLLMSMIFLFLALLSKETAITMLAVIPLTLYFKGSSTFRSMTRTWLFFLIPAALFLYIRSNVLGNTGGLPAVSADDNFLAGTQDFFVRTATAFTILARYLLLLFVPYRLTSDYSAGEFTLVGWSDPVALISLVMHLGLGIYGLFRFRKRDIIGYGILFYFITIFLFSNLLILIGASMAERFLYFPSLGFCMVIGALLYKLVPRSVAEDPARSAFKVPPVLLVISLVVLGLYTAKTMARSQAWKNNLELYSHDSKTNPDNYRLHYYLGRHLTKEIAVNEKDSVVKAEQFKQGIDELLKSNKLNPRFLDAYQQLAVASTRVKDYPNAEKYFEIVLKYIPNDVPTLLNLGGCYGLQGKIDLAEKIFLKTLDVDPRNTRALMSLATTYNIKGDKTRAQEYYNQAVSIDPSLKSE